MDSPSPALRFKDHFTRSTVKSIFHPEGTQLFNELLGELKTANTLSRNLQPQRQQFRLFYSCFYSYDRSSKCTENFNFCVFFFFFSNFFRLKCRNHAPFLMMSFGASPSSFLLSTISWNLFPPQCTLISNPENPERCCCQLWTDICITVSSAFTNLYIYRKFFERHQHISITTRTCITYPLL